MDNMSYIILYKFREWSKVLGTQVPDSTLSPTATSPDPVQELPANRVECVLSGWNIWRCLGVPTPYLIFPGERDHI